MKSSIYKAERLCAVKRKAKGFTLVELLVTIAIVAMISAIALPSLNGFLVQLRVDNEISELQRLLLTARNTAINTGKDTSVCPLKSSGTACTGGSDWTGAIGVLNEDGVIKEKAAINSSDKLLYGFTDITYTATGQTLANRAGTFSYCPKDHSDLNRGIEIAINGRTYITADTDNDGKDENRSGSEISCSS